jgi:ABC-2 type transport system ATP-binding protein
MIKIQGLKKSYGKKSILQGLNLEIREKEFFTILGPNGAGKTTLVSILATLLPFDGGSVSLGEYNSKADQKSLRPLIGISPQESAFAPRLTVKENLLFMAELYGMAPQVASSRCHEVMGDLSLISEADTPASKLSGGWQRRLSLALAILHRPRYLFLDEPSLGLDPGARETLWEYLKKLKKQATIVMTTHYLEEADTLSDRIAFLNQGEITALGSPQEIRQRHSQQKLILRGDFSEALMLELGTLAETIIRTDSGLELRGQELSPMDTFRVLERHRATPTWFSMKQGDLQELYQGLNQKMTGKAFPQGAVK